MNRRLSYIMMVILSLSLAAGCNQEVIQEESYGYLGINLANDLSEDIVVKAGTAADEKVFAVDVLNASGQLVAHADDHRTVTSADPIRLQIGNYDVVATNGTSQNAAFDAPFYKGSKNVRIYPDKQNTVDLTCSLANTIFSVEFPEEFAGKFDVYEVTVTNGVGDALTFSNRPTSGSTLEAGFDAEAYFAVTGTLAWELYLRNSDGGEWTDKRTYTDVRARQHYHLKFSLGEDMTADGAFVVKVALDNSMDESSHEVTLDFDTRNMPSMSSNPEFPVESGNTISVPVGNTTTKRLEFSTAEGLANLRTYHSNEVMAAAGLPEFVEYVGASDEILNSLSAAGISVIQHGLTKAVAAGAQGATLDMTSFFSKLPVGMYEIGFIVIDAKGHYDTFELAIEIISDVDAEAVSVKSGWACFALFEGRYFTSDAPAGLSFQYKEVSGSQWTEMNPSEMDVDAASLRYTAIVKGLKPSTSYVFRAVSAEDKDTREIPFSTAAAEDVHNLSFDYWYKDGDAWMPNQSSSIYVWDSANPGTAGLGVVPTTPEESDVVKGKAARLQTSTAMSMLAAGNIYIGQFGSVQGLGAELDWGYPFTSRPLALRGYYKYAPKAIDKVKDPYKDLKGQPDQCQIQILLTDWADRFNINTSKKTFVEIDTDPDIIAHGSVTSSNDDSGYVRFTMPIVYRSMRTPKYIVIVAAASRYGDYFTGGVGSVLKIDEFELVYDPAELTDEEYAAVFSNVSPF